MKTQNNTVPEVCTLLLKHLLWPEESVSEAVQQKTGKKNQKGVENYITFDQGDII